MTTTPTTTRALALADHEGETLDVLGSTMLLKATAEQTGGTYEVVLVEAGPGGDIVPHRHPWEEFYFVVDGTLEVQVGRRIHRAGPGSFVTMPPRCLHGFRVLGDRARFLHVSFGPGATATFREYHEVVPHSPGPDDLGPLWDINARHGVEVELPPELLSLLATGG